MEFCCSKSVLHEQVLRPDVWLQSQVAFGGGSVHMPRPARLLAAPVFEYAYCEPASSSSTGEPKGEVLALSRP